MATSDEEKRDFAFLQGSIRGVLPPENYLSLRVLVSLTFVFVLFLCCVFNSQPVAGGVDSWDFSYRFFIFCVVLCVAVPCVTVLWAENWQIIKQWDNNSSLRRKAECWNQSFSGNLKFPVCTSITVFACIITLLWPTPRRPETISFTEVVRRLSILLALGAANSWRNPRSFSFSSFMSFLALTQTFLKKLTSNNFDWMISFNSILLVKFSHFIFCCVFPHQSPHRLNSKLFLLLFFYR